MKQESTNVASGGRTAARAAARILAVNARMMLSNAEDILDHAGEVDAAKSANRAIEAATGVISATYDGPNQVFACKR